jgi:hypothetical protein
MSDEPRIERAVRRVLAERRPDQTPESLRGRIAEIPASGTPRLVIVQGIARAAATLAAAITLLVGVVLVTQDGGITGGPSPSAGGAPGPTFDPTLAGFGILTIDDGNDLRWFFVALLVVSLIITAAASSGWRRVALGAVAILPIAWAAIGTFAPIDLQSTGFGPGIGLRMVDGSPWFDQRAAVVDGGPSSHYAYGIVLINPGWLPVTVEGVAVRPEAPETPHIDRPTAVWLDAEQNGGMTGPDRPFSPITVSTDAVHTIWIVNLASDCAAGPFPKDTELPAPGGYSYRDSVTLRVNVLGWNRTVDIAIFDGLRIVTPGHGSCP